MHIFIISWSGQHEKGIAIAQRLSPLNHHVSIVYSDANPDLILKTDCHQIKRPNALFWGDKFKACLDACTSDVMLVIHADCQCDDWVSLAEKCHATLSATPHVGVWTPRIHGTPYDISTTHVADIKGTTLCLVADTDALVFALSKPVQKRMQSATYQDNLYGWGINGAFCAYAYASHLWVVMDTSVQIHHQPSTAPSYPFQEARRQKSQFMTQLTMPEAIQRQLLNSHMEKKKLQLKHP
ncbi:MAG: hypothetical protein HQ446_02445 [Polaromonas sp.]|nr:hypothetical protein [Polaromonas sp.]